MFQNYFLYSSCRRPISSRWMERFMKRWHNRNSQGGEQPQGQEGEEPRKEEGMEGGPDEDYLRTVGESVAAMLDPFGKISIILIFCFSFWLDYKAID